MSIHQTVPYKVYLDADGQRYIAQGQRPFNWNFRIVGEYDRVPEHSVLIAEFDPFWPDRTEAVVNGVADLRRRQQDIRATAESEARELETRVQELLAIEGPKA